MKKILFASITTMLLLGHPACTGDYDIYPDEMSKVLMFKDAGTYNVTVYSAQEQAQAQIVVLKGGVAPEQEVVATVRAMSQEEFNEYKETNGGVAFNYLPSNCYTLGESGVAEVNFAGGESYRLINVDLDVKNIGGYLEANPNLDLSPAIPLVLECGDAKINENNNMIFLVPEYRVPKVGFAEETAFSSAGANGLTATIELPLESQWDIPCEVVVDQAALDEYNTLNGTGYRLMSSDAYSLSGTVNMAIGKSSADLKITADPTKAGLFDVIPLRLKSAGIDGIEVDDEADICMVGFDINGYLVPHTGTGAIKLSTNAQEPTEGDISNLLDSDVNTFFHTAWSVTVSEDHYIQITLPKAYNEVAIQYTNRNSGTSNTPAWFDFYVGTSDSNLQLHKKYTWNDGDPEKNFGADIHGGAAEMNILTPARFASPKSVFRIVNTQSWNGNKFFCMSTINVYAK